MPRFSSIGKADTELCLPVPPQSAMPGPTQPVRGWCGGGGGGAGNTCECADAQGMFSLRAGPFVHVAWNVAASGCVCLRSARVALVRRPRRATYSLEMYRGGHTLGSDVRPSLRFIAFRAAGRGLLLAAKLIVKRKTTVLRKAIGACSLVKVLYYANFYLCNVFFVSDTVPTACH